MSLSVHGSRINRANHCQYMKYLFISLLCTSFFIGLAHISVAEAQVAETDAVVNSKSRLEKIGGITGFLQPNQGLFKDDDTFYTRFAQIVNIFLGMIGIIATIYVLYAGTKWITAAGNAEQVDEAKDGIRSAVIGLGVVFFAYIIVNFVVARILAAVTL